MRNLWLFLMSLWIALFLWRVFAHPYPIFLPYALTGVIGLGVALALVETMRRLLTLPQALLEHLEVQS